MRIESLLFNTEYPLLIIDDAGTWDRKALTERALELETVLIGKGIKPLDLVGIICANSSSFIVSVMAVLRTGAIAVLIDPQMPVESVREILHKSTAKYVCVSGANPESRFSSASSELQNFGDITFLKEGLGEWKSGGGQRFTEYSREPSLSDNDPAFLLFTSGTTGSPKGAVLTHRAIMDNVDAINDYMHPGQEDTFIITKTLVHCSTLTGELLIALKAGAKIIVKNPVIPPTALLKRIEELKPTVAFVNPTILRLMVKASFKGYDVSSIRLLYTSGAVADRGLLREAEAVFDHARILNVYGLTEAGPRVTAQRGEDSTQKYGSVGKPILGVKVNIRTEDGRICRPNETGIVFVATRSVMEGYWNDIEATREKLVDGWIKTGDLGYLDEDGDLFILGRADEVIIRGAHNIDPYRIENTIRKLSEINDCVVFGVPDRIHGNRIICLYRKMENAKQISREEIVACCNKYLAPFEIPQDIYEVDSIPTSALGKVSRRLALEFYYKEIKKIPC